MKLKLLCLILSVLSLFTNSTANAAGKPCTITPSVSEITIKLDESIVIEFEISGDIPKGAQATLTREKRICDVSWGENRRSTNGVVLSLNVTGILLGETPLTVSIVDHEDISATVILKVINEPGTISFMGIPWDITPEEFDQALQEKGLEFTKKTNNFSDSWFSFDGMSFENPYLGLLEIPSKSFSYRSSQSNPLVKVAGYNVDSIFADFKPSYSVERKKVGEPYRLARASYKIYDSDIPKEMTQWEVYNDLISKLTKLYGEPTGSENGTIYNVTTTWWHAKDGTGVSLKTTSSFGLNVIEIEYGTADESAYMNNIYAIRQWEKQQVVDGLSDDVDGL